MPAWFTCLNFGLPPHEWRPQSSRCVLRQKQRNDDYLDYCSVFCLLCFLPCHPQTHKASESGWEAQASSPLCSVWLCSYDVTVCSLSSLYFSWLWAVLTIPLLPLSGCAPLWERADLYFSSSYRNVFPLLLFKNIACPFFSSREGPQPWTWLLHTLNTM